MQRRHARCAFKPAVVIVMFAAAVAVYNVWRVAGVAGGMTPETHASMFTRLQRDGSNELAVHGGVSGFADGGFRKHGGVEKQGVGHHDNDRVSMASQLQIGQHRVQGVNKGVRIDAGKRAADSGIVAHVFRDQQAQPYGTVLILTTLKQAVSNLDGYLRRLAALDYPKDKISLGVLVSDSNDGSWEYMRREAVRLREQGYAHVTVLQKDFRYRLTRAARHEYDKQLRRRIIIAKSRNYLMQQALRTEDWVLWIDVDVVRFPPTLIQDLQAYGKAVIVPNCMSPGGTVYDANNWQETEESVAQTQWMDTQQLLVEGYDSVLKTHHRQLDAYRGNKSVDSVPLDGVGGTTILIKARVVREGLVFPTFVLDHAVETEGLGRMAKRMGYQPYGLPNYLIHHGAVGAA